MSMRNNQSRSRFYHLGFSISLASLLLVPAGLTDTSAKKAPSSAERAAVVTSTRGEPPSVAKASGGRTLNPAAAGVSSAHPKPAGATINVTTTTQKVSSDGGCSLQEAIFAANFDASQAISPTAMDLTSFITTECTAGNGDDTIELQAGAVYQMSSIVNDPLNQLGPTATPLIFTNITIEGNGATLELLPGAPTMRCFAIADLYTDISVNGHTIPAGTTGHLTLRNVHIRNFRVHGGNGVMGGGGGMGAGGAVYLKDGGLTVENCTFDGNSATGGNGGVGNGGNGGGGGGLSGNGGSGGNRVDSAFNGGGGGGGSRGSGGSGGVDGLCGGSGCEGGGGGGGGTVTDGQDGPIGDGFGQGGFKCGGDGGPSGTFFGGADGNDGSCPGGGGGGGASLRRNFLTSGDGGNGNYGGGGGGGGYVEGQGGDGGFGGGGGAGALDSDGGNGGFGGGGGGTDANGGFLGGHGSQGGGGGGAGLGGAIFNDSGVVTISNCTFAANAVTGGHSPVANDGQGQGGAIFSRNGSLTVLNATIGGNQSTSDHTGGGIVVFGDSTAGFTLRNTIIANNGVDECFFEGGVTAGGSGNLIVQNFGCPGNVTPMPADPQLGLLQLNAPGNTPTMAITTSSPAFDAGDDNNCQPTDQRGVPRPQFMHCDIGAYEVGCSTITCPDSVTQSNDPDKCGAVVNFPAPTTNGPCIPVCTPPSGSFFPVGTTTVTCSAESVSCTFTVTVNDTQKPTINCSNVPPQSANADANCSATVPEVRALVRAQSSDNCTAQASLTVTQSPVQGSTVSGAGSHPIVVTVTDASNNSANCTVAFTVIDNTPPTITCPANVTAVTDQNACPNPTCQVVSYPAPVASDNCPGVTAVCNPPPGSCFPTGVTTVTCTATDTSGNTATCSFTVATFDVALQDDSDPSTILLWNSITGSYRFCCNGITFTGIGNATNKGCVYTLQHNPADRRVLGRVDKAVHAGSASIQAPAGTIRCTITDRNTANDTFACS